MEGSRLVTNAEGKPVGLVEIYHYSPKTGERGSFTLRVGTNSPHLVPRAGKEATARLLASDAQVSFPAPAATT